MAVLPNDISWLGGFIKAELLAQEQVRGLVFQRNFFGVVTFERDEGRCGDGKLVKLQHQFLNFRILLPHAIEVITADCFSTSAQSKDKLSVAVGEDDVGDLGCAVIDNTKLLLLI